MRTKERIGSVLGLVAILFAALFFTCTKDPVSTRSNQQESLGMLDQSLFTGYSANPAAFWQGVAILPDTAYVGSTAIDSFTVSPGLPAGLSLNKTTGLITGSPLSAQTAATYVVMAQSSSNSATVQLSITVKAAPTSLSYSANPKICWLGVPIVLDSATVTGSVDSFMITPSLPSGLFLNKTTGSITGTPLTASAATAYTITAKNPAGIATVGLSITVNAPPSGLSYTVNPSTYWEGVAITANTARVTGLVDSFTSSPALPSGLSLDKSAGSITGTPQIPQAATVYTIAAKNSAGAATVALTITVQGPPQALSYAVNPATWWQGVAKAADNATVTGVVDSFTVSPALPTGLLFNKTTGAITGTPSVSQGLAAFTVTAMNISGSCSVALNITVNAPPSNLSYSASPATYWLGVPIAQNSATITGLVDSFTVSPALSAGLAITKSSGAITGTPTVAKAATNYTITARNPAGSCSAQLNITVDAAPSNLSYSSNSPTYWQGVAITQNSATVTGAVDSFTSSPALPSGLTLNKTTGAITGTPAAAQTVAAYTVTATNNAGTTTRVLTITVNAAPTNLSYATNPATYWRGVYISQNSPTVTGVVTSYTVTPSLPAGLTISASGGGITGAPGAGQTAASYTVTAANPAGSATSALTITINNPPSALSYAASSSTYWQGVTIAANNATVTGVVQSYTIYPSLPAGLGISATTGAISGTPTVARSSIVYTVTASNPAGAATVGVTLLVNAPPSNLRYSANPAVYIVQSAVTPTTMSVTGVVDSYTISSALPAGLSFNKATATITGTPVHLMLATTYTITAYNPAGTGSMASTIIIMPPWSPVGSGMNSYVSAMVADNAGNVYVGGSFTTANGVAANHIAKWDGSSWNALGGGTNKNVYALALDNAGNLYAGGNFDSAGGVKVNGTAKWNGSSWSALGNGYGTPVYALVCDRTGNLYVGGSCGTGSSPGIGKWNGASWSGVGGGVSGQVNALACDSSNNIYAGGLFAKAGGASVNNIACWNGSSWSAFGIGTNGKVQSIYVNSSGSIPIVYAGGIFTAAGGITANGIAQWNGASWNALGSGVGGNGIEVGCIVPDNNGKLFAAGYFSVAGGVSALSIARWDGTSWCALSGGLTSEADGMVFDASGKKLWVGGMFGMASGTTVSYIATCLP